MDQTKRVMHRTALSSLILPCIYIIPLRIQDQELTEPCTRINVKRDQARNMPFTSSGNESPKEHTINNS
eukprot:c54924_g1_i1 orf=52-258(+)